jgi:hypothetical protein
VPRAPLAHKEPQAHKAQQARKEQRDPLAQLGQPDCKGQLALMDRQVQQALVQQELLAHRARLEQPESALLEQQAPAEALVQLDWALLEQLAIKVKLEALAQLVKLVQRGLNLQSSLARL